MFILGALHVIAAFLLNADVALGTVCSVSPTVVGCSAHFVSHFCIVTQSVGACYI